jgi:hypothetical protein
MIATNSMTTPNTAVTIASRRSVGAAPAAVMRPPTTAPAPISAVIVARPVAPASNVNSASSGNVTLNSKVSMPMMSSMISVVRRFGVLHAYLKPSRSCPLARGVRLVGWSSCRRIKASASTTAA